MKWGVWCVATSKWLRDGAAQPKRFDDKVDAIVAANSMYSYKVMPFVEGK
jgi:hypothetical protein